jgi:catechol 2,3-dioxygenase-like lactoylglutathione lyase family enzyme
MPAPLVQVVMGAADPARLARFWSAALGWPIVVEEADEVVVEPAGDDSAQRGQLPLIFVRVSEVKTTKNRVHLDLASVSVEQQAALVVRLEELGARRLDIGQGDVSWVVMADPEGNEFCVVSHLGSVGKDPASAFAGIGPVAAVVFDCADPEGIAPFWAAATRWAALGRDDQGVWLRDVTAGGPYLDLHRVSEPKQAELHVRLAVAPVAADDRAAEVERLRDIGAREADAGRADARWVVLTDPEGNELGVLTPR